MSLLQSREHHNTVTVLIRCSRELPSCFVVLAICVCAAKENVSDHLHALHFCLSLARLLLLLLLPSSCSTPLDRSACCGPFVLQLLELCSRVSRLRLLRVFLVRCINESSRLTPSSAASRAYCDLFAKSCIFLTSKKFVCFFAHSWYLSNRRLTSVENSCTHGYWVPHVALSS